MAVVPLGLLASFCVIGFGSLTSFLSGEDIPATGEAGRIQPSNILDNRFCESELRQSFGGMKGLIEAEALGLEDWPILAVPPSVPESSSSSDSWRLARRLTVSSEGSKEAVEDERDFERRYHSSGTQNRKCLDADGSRGFILKGASRMAERLALKGIRVDSDEGHEHISK